MPNARVLRDILNRTTVAKTQVQRKALRHITHNETLPASVRYQAQLQLNAMPRAARTTSVKNRCAETGRGRGILSAFRLCRYQFRLKARAGELPGVQKAS